MTWCERCDTEQGSGPPHLPHTCPHGAACAFSDTHRWPDVPRPALVCAECAARSIQYHARYCPARLRYLSHAATGECVCGVTQADRIFAALEKWMRAQAVAAEGVVRLVVDVSPSSVSASLVILNGPSQSAGGVDMRDAVAQLAQFAELDQ